MSELKIDVGMDQNKIVTVKFTGNNAGNAATKAFHQLEKQNKVGGAQVGNTLYLIKHTANSASNIASAAAQNQKKSTSTRSEKNTNTKSELAQQRQSAKNEAITRMADVEQKKIQESLKGMISGLNSNLDKERKALKASGKFTDEKIDSMIAKRRSKALNSPPISLLRERLNN